LIEYSQVHGVTRQLEYALPLYGRHGVVRQRWGNWDTQLCVHGIIKCGKSSYPKSQNPQETEEGYILISAYTDEDFATLCRVTGLRDLASKYKAHADRVKAESQVEIYGELERWANDKTKEDVARILDEAEISTQPVWNAKEVSEHPHWRERGSLQWLDDPYYGDVFAQGPAYHLSETPPRVKWTMRPVGANTEFILGKLLGMSRQRIQALEAAEVI